MRYTKEQYAAISDRKFAIRAAGTTSRELAERFDVAETTISMTINGHRTNADLRAAISDAIGCDYAEMWGEPRPKIDTELRKAS